MEKIKICYGPTKHLFPHHSAQVLPAHPPPSPLHLPRSLHTPGIWLCLSAGLRGAQSTGVRDSASPGCGAGPSQPASLSEERDTPGSQPQGCCSHALKFAGKNGLNTSQPWTCFPSAPNLLPKPTAASWNSPCLFHPHQQSFCAQVLHSDGSISRWHSLCLFQVHIQNISCQTS